MEILRDQSKGCRRKGLSIGLSPSPTYLSTVSCSHAYRRPLPWPSLTFSMGTAMDQITIKTPIPKCLLYWCLIEFTDWRYSQYFDLTFVN
jgi:hypothetical protein